MGMGNKEMLAMNTGFGLLQCMVGHACSTAEDTASYERWAENRLPAVLDRLQAIAQRAEVDVFIDTYAGSLANRLVNLVAGGAMAQAVEASVDFYEELLRQAERYAAAVPAAGPPEGDPMLPGMEWEPMPQAA